MSDETDAGAAWTYDESHVDIEHTQDLRNDSPLQYTALYAECQPSDGKVTLSKLGAILARARIPNEKSAVILEYCGDPETRLVSETDFFWALAQTSCLQANPDHEVVYTDSNTAAVNSAHLNELRLADTLTDDVEDGSGSSGSQWAVPDYNPTAQHTINVSLVTKNAGSFFLKHAVYSIDGTVDGKPIKVLRRYRDFASLTSVLIQRYPFRALPVLPPKRLSMNGKYLVGESQDAFLHRRAAGLSRFLNLLVQHPVVSKDNHVGTFLFADSQFDPRDSIKRNEKGDELTNKMASPLFISQWNDAKIEEWKSNETATHEYMNQVTALCVVMEKYIKRIESEQQDCESMGRSFVGFARFLYPLYPDQQDDLGSIQQKLESLSQYTDTRHQNLAAELEQLREGPLLQLKLFRDMLSSLIELYGRLKSRGGNSIAEQQKQIAMAQRKLASLSTREDVTEEELHKVRTRIQQAQASIRDQTNRDWLIKMVFNQEIQMVQTMQYQISRIVRSFGDFISSSAAKQAELTSQIADSTSSAPLKI